MAHSTTICDITFIYNGNDSGDVTISLPLLPEDTDDSKPHTITVAIPFAVLREFVGRAINRQLIAKLEGMTGNETLNALR